MTPETRPTLTERMLDELRKGCACDSDIERTCRDNWPDDVGSWCGGCQILAVGEALTAVTKERNILLADNEAYRSARADAVSWVPTLRSLRDRLAHGAENIDAAIVALEYDPVNCSTCGQPLNGSVPMCVACNLVDALRRSVPR